MYNLDDKGSLVMITILKKTAMLFQEKGLLLCNKTISMERLTLGRPNKTK